MQFPLLQHEIWARKIKDQEKPNFSAFDKFGSLSNDSVFEPGRLGKRSDGTKISKLHAKPEELERIRS